ncbi:MAG: transglycosylase family protein, partial [Acidimicrobiales bacterium]|nr:transglycosylase family protein [Acidimicrobiales bacterium]
GTGYPHQHSRIEQIRRANLLKDRAGLGQWPHCGSRFYG